MIEFGSLAELAHHLTQETVGGLVDTRKGLDRAARLLEREAKREFGTYQDGAGPFADWPELAESTKDDRVAKGFTENDPLLRTGGLRDSIEHETDDWEAVVGSTSDIMPYQEFGTATIPPRPVLGIALYRRADKIAEMIGGFAVRGLIGTDPVHGSLGYDMDVDGDD